MYKICLENFRGFKKQDSINIRPITLLVGENSSGKTSFLASLNFLLKYINGEEITFNTPPFQLGTYKQISHYRGGRAGRAKNFKLSIDIEDINILISMSFKDNEGVPDIYNISIRSENVNFELENIRENTYRVYISENEIKSKFDYSGIINIKSIDQILNILNIINLFSKGNLSAVENKLVDNRINIFKIFNKLNSIYKKLNVISLSPIRSYPERTYTPGKDVHEYDGSFVPYDLAKIYRIKSQKQDKWLNIYKEIKDFGRKSELFDDVNIRAFGRTNDDPFQLEFSVGGPKRNIIDMGYGISQVLPIIYLPIYEKRNTIFLLQQPEVHLHPKAQAELGSFFMKKYIEKNMKFIIETHSDFILDRIRIEIMKKNLSHEDVSILYFKKEGLENVIYNIRLDEHGDLIDVPNGYREFFQREAANLLGIEIE